MNGTAASGLPSRPLCASLLRSAHNQKGVRYWIGTTEYPTNKTWVSAMTSERSELDKDVDSEGIEGR